MAAKLTNGRADPVGCTDGHRASPTCAARPDVAASRHYRLPLNLRRQGYPSGQVVGGSHEQHHAGALCSPRTNKRRNPYRTRSCASTHSAVAARGVSNVLASSVSICSRHACTSAGSPRRPLCTPRPERSLGRHWVGRRQFEGGVVIGRHRDLPLQHDLPPFSGRLHHGDAGLQGGGAPDAAVVGGSAQDGGVV